MSQHPVCNALVVSVACMVLAPHARATVRAQASSNYIQQENAKPGTTDWQLTNPGWTSGVIEGYADATSVNRGGSISFFVNTSDPSFTIEIFRIGYYQGLGGRRMTAPVTLHGTQQIIPAPDPVTGLIECNWINPYVLTIPNTADPTNWMSGHYYAKLTSSSGVQWYIAFVVRDDARASDLILAQAITTAEAYNPWGGKSLYGTIANRSDTANKARKVSFHRPYYGDETWGAGQFSNLNGYKSWEWGMVQFLEQNGYDVTYATSIDVDRDPNLLLNHKAFLSVAHDEYWSWQMRDNVERARDTGINLGFFSANTSYWQVRFENSPTTGQPYSVMVGYKEFCNTEDPVTPIYLRTCRFRDAPVNRSEDQMLGVMYITQSRQPFVVEDASHWLFAGTGLKNGDALVNPDGSDFVGYEVDAVSRLSPLNLQRAAHSPATATNANFSDMTTYRAASGATVFASGSILWTYAVPQIVQVTKNALARLISDAFADTTPVRPPLPMPFQAADIGDVGRAGFVALAGADSFTLDGAGQDAFNGQDALFYAYQGLTGDGSITARITAVQDYWNNRAGLMIRESLAPGARYVSLVSRPSDSKMNGTSGVNQGVEFTWKSTTGGAPAIVAQQDMPLPNWVRLTRTGSVFDAYISADGTTWTHLGSTTLAMNRPALIGASVASAQHGVWLTASYDHVAVVGGSAPPVNAGPSLPSGWSDADVGAVGPPGSAGYDAGSHTFTVTGAGADVWGTADAFHYAYTTLSGDGTIVARVATLSSGAAWIKAGVMLRSTLDPASNYGFMLVSDARGVAFQRRVTAGGLSTSNIIAGITAPTWVKVTRAGNTITASQSGDGVSWTVVGSDTIAMGGQVLAGLAVSSHTNSATATATFDNVSITSAAPPVALPSGWSDADIGAVGLPGSATENPISATFTVNGAGADVWTTADAFHYAYTKLTGDGTIVARVATVSPGEVWVKAGVMLRDTIDPASMHAFMIVSYARGLAFQRRLATGGLTTSTAGAVVTAPYWVKLTRTGNTFTASASPDGASWTVVGTDTIPMGPQVLAGLAVSSHTNTAIATATFDHVSVTAAPSPAPSPGGQCSSVALSQQSFYSGAPKSNWSVIVTAPTPSCAWTASIDQPWLLLNGVSGPTTIAGTGSIAISLSTTDNGTGAFRYGTFTIAGTSYKVTQEF